MYCGILVISAKEPVAFKKGNELASSVTVRVKTKPGNRAYVANLLKDFLYDFINSDDWRTVGTNRGQEIYDTAQRVYAEFKSKDKDYISFNGGGRVSYEIKNAEPEFDVILE